MKSLNRKRLLRQASVALLGLLVLWLVLWLAVPAVLKSQVQRLGSEKLGRNVTLGAVDFKPWTLELSLRDLRIDGLAGAAQPLLSVDRIYLDAEMQSLLRLAPVLDALEIDKPVLHLAQTAPGQYDVDDILQRLASAPAAEESGAPPRFALYNIAVRDGAVDFHDAIVERSHTLRGLTLSLPFLSNLASQQKALVEPRLAFELNGSPFDSSAHSTPFLESRATELRLAFKGLDLASYQGYMPQSLPVRLAAGVLDADLEIGFEQADQAQVRVRGQVALQQARLHDARGDALLQFERLAVQLRDVQPLRQQVLVDSVVLNQPQVFAHRNAQGVINWLGLAPKDGQGGGQEEPLPAESSPWRVEVAQITLEQGRAEWRDQFADAGPNGAHLVLGDIAMQARDVAWPLVQPFGFDGRLTLASASAIPVSTKASSKFSAAVDGPGVLAFSGQAAATQGQVGLQLESLPLALGMPYLSAHWRPGVQGRATAVAGLGWSGEATVIKLARLSLDNLALQDQAAPARIRQLLVEDADLHLGARHLRVGRLSLDQPQFSVQRDARGRWMHESWLAASAKAGAARPAGPAKPAASVQRPWDVQLENLAISGGEVNFRDALPERPVQVQLSGLQLQMRDFAPLATAGTASQVRVSARVASGRRAQAGRLSYDGSLRLAPLLTQGTLRASDLPLHAFEPYVAGLLNVRVLRAEGGFSGRVRYEAAPAGPRLALKGDAQLHDLRVRAVQGVPQPGTGERADATTVGVATGARGALAAQTLAGGEDLLHWKVLALRGLDLAMAPGTATQLRVRETALSDFYARVIVQPNGRINLQDIVKSSAAPTVPVPAERVQGGAQASAPVPPPAPPLTPKEPAAVVHIGPVVLTGGTVAFSDYFIQPNYSADLSALAGRLGAFSSVSAAGQAPQMADLELRGRAQGTADLEILGQLNPLVQPLALDITARMSDLELSPLTPYAIKYAGHGIERGKLSMDVNYRVEPGGQLTASNKLVLNQLTFGDPVEGAPASLPVRLATALLADRNGVIDLDLPISGSLNDPQFRLAPVIFKIIGNLVMKAVTAPFALLASAFGGEGESTGAVVFAHGTARLDSAGRESLDKIAKALQERPALQMTVVGEASLEVERETWKLEQLQQMLLAEKRRRAARAGEPVDRITAVAPAETAALLKAVYLRADITKPRNLVGMAKDLPDNEMQALLLAHISVPDNAMRELALARGVAVRDYLAAQNLPAERLFLGAPTQPPAGSDWKPQARLELAVR